MIKKITSKIPALLAVLLVVWIGLSWVDVVADNNTTSPEHGTLNFFVLISEGVTD